MYVLTDELLQKERKFFWRHWTFWTLIKNCACTCGKQIGNIRIIPYRSPSLNFDIFIKVLTTCEEKNVFSSHIINTFMKSENIEIQGGWSVGNYSDLFPSKFFCYSQDTIIIGKTHFSCDVFSKFVFKNASTIKVTHIYFLGHSFPSPWYLYVSLLHPPQARADHPESFEHTFLPHEEKHFGTAKETFPPSIPGKRRCYYINHWDSSKRIQYFLTRGVFYHKSKGGVFFQKKITNTLM